MYLDGAVKACGRSTAFWGVRAASPAERKQKMQCLSCENAQRRHCIFGFSGECSPNRRIPQQGTPPDSGCKNVHDIGTPFQLPGKRFPQHIVTAAAFEKSFVVFHGKIQGAIPVQAPAETALRCSGKSQQLAAFFLRQAGFPGGVIVRRQLELLFKAVHGVLHRCTPDELTQPAPRGKGPAQPQMLKYRLA